MKYLNNFKIFESEFIAERPLVDGYIIDELKLILLELEDEGFQCRIWVNDRRFYNSETYGLKKENIDSIEIEISPSGNKLEHSEAKILYDVLKRILKFLEIEKFINVGINKYRESDEYSDIEEPVWQIDYFKSDELVGFSYFMIEANRKFIPRRKNNK